MRFRGTTEEGEVVEFKSYCKDSDHVIEYGSEIGIQKNIWKYVKKDSLICVEVEDLESQLKEARKENTELLIKIKAHKKQPLSVAENIKFRELKEIGE